MKAFYRYCDQRPSTNLEGINKVMCWENFISQFDTFHDYGDNELILIRDNCKTNLIAHDITIDTNLGNGESFQYALDMALKLPDSEYVYFVEDDYLHKLGALNVLLEGLEAFDNGFITLYDHADKYDTRKINHLVQVRGKMAGEVTSLYLTKSCHWKITNSTTMTFAAKVSNLRRAEKIMRKHAVDRPTDYAMWLEIKKELDMNVYSSVPGYATHCETPWITPLTDWNEVW